jgi:4-diphosphocytidyl-2-C-methyl-D-erythritol kinase
VQRQGQSFAADPSAQARPATYREAAPAKINLTLSVLGRRPDGYHAIEGLVAFAAVGDQVTLSVGPQDAVTTTGPFAAEIDGPNLLQAALRLLREHDPELRLGSVLLDKQLPVAAGLGGGSADAAALLRAVRGANPDRAGRVNWHELARRLGADVPVCLAGKPALMSGIGDRIEPLAAPGLPPAAVVLANPRLPLSTAEVYRALGAGPAPESDLPSRSLGRIADLVTLVEYMRQRSNDLERPALRLLPAIGDVKSALAGQAGCLFAGMSGSGPTCFGIFADEAGAARAAEALRRAHAGWWIVATGLDRSG